MQTIAAFIKSEEGAITVDWVVLTAGIATLGCVVMMGIGGGAVDLSDEIGDEVDQVDVMTF